MAKLRIESDMSWDGDDFECTRLAIETNGYGGRSMAAVALLLQRFGAEGLFTLGDAAQAAIKRLANEPSGK